MNSELDKRLKEEDKEGLDQLVKAHQTKIFSKPRPYFRLARLNRSSRKGKKGAKKRRQRMETKWKQKSLLAKASMRSFLMILYFFQIAH